MPRPHRWLAVTAFLVILAVTVFQVWQIDSYRRESADPVGEIRVGAIDMQAEVLARVRAAIAAFEGDEPGSYASILESTRRWSEGSASMRLARSILLASCDDPDGAMQQFTATVDACRGAGIEEEASPLLRTVAAIYRRGATAQVDDGAALRSWAAPAEADLAAARERLGIYVALGEGFVANEEGPRREVLRSGWRVGVAGLAFLGWVGLALVGGLAALVTVLVMAAFGALRFRTGRAERSSAVLLEVFACFMAVFLVVSWILEEVAARSTALEEFQEAHHGIWIAIRIAIELGASWLALAWWRVRGGSWASLRALAGFHWRPGPWRCIGLGFVGYAMALVLGLAGLMLSMMIGSLLGVERLGDPKHPIHDVLRSDEPGSTLLVLFFGVVLAPFLEEIFFRGVLYRGLRDRLGAGRAALVVGAVSAMIVSSAIFAAIHPQGLLFAPILAGLGAGFCLVREWSGSVVPGMVAHAINNGVMLGLAVVLTS